MVCIFYIYRCKLVRTTHSRTEPEVNAKPKDLSLKLKAETKDLITKVKAKAENLSLKAKTMAKEWPRGLAPALDYMDTGTCGDCICKMLSPW